MVTKAEFYRDLNAVTLTVPLYEFRGPRNKFDKDFRKLPIGSKVVFLPDDNSGRCEYQSARVIQDYDPLSARLFHSGYPHLMSIKPSEVKKVGTWSATYLEIRTSMRLSPPPPKPITSWDGTLT